MQTDLITKVYFNEHLTHSCVGMPQGLQALLSSFNRTLISKVKSATQGNDWNDPWLRRDQHRDRPPGHPGQL